MELTLCWLHQQTQARSCVVIASLTAPLTVHVGQIQQGMETLLARLEHEAATGIVAVDLNAEVFRV